ncbi:hypothetical protein [Exiguobacterium alkaliphilum]|uniref:DUF1524 domain-containing protein n=1 Tax=Exiguobacterium alkaliphilum TaxID=1428684 RepID=A0ABT2L0V6_9BACL|nr:hypothetical protein [Exiguobacterium alkaliphilum]MCT4796349.1 DUF1524 domain-containing protein [Exiguobacterium alkaliphilum]
MSHSFRTDEEMLFQYFRERFDICYEQHELDIKEYEKTIFDLHAKSEQEKNSMFDDLIGEYGQVVSRTIIQTFGLAPFFHQNQDGGDVTTKHNARQGIYAREEDKFERSKYGYDSSKKIVLHQNEKRKGKQVDSYTGKSIDRANVDHVVPLNSFHKNGGFLLDDNRKKAFSSDTRNLVVTDETLNKSKGDLRLDDFRNHRVGGQEDTNDVRFAIDEKRARQIADQANVAYDDHQISRIETMKGYTSRSLQAGVEDGLRLGAREAIGMVLHTLISELFKEMKQYAKQLKTYRSDGIMLTELNKMAERVIKNTQKQLSGLLRAATKIFGEGILSGFMSSILTTVINTFITTKKRVVRIIREGFLSIVRAFRVLFTNPQNLSQSMLYREVTKLLITGLVVAGGIAFEEVFENMLRGLALPFLPLISSTMVGVLTGIALATIMYMIDQVWSMLPSTSELMANSAELIHNRMRLQTEFDSIAMDLSVSQTDDILSRMTRTNLAIESTIDFFEE